VLFEINGENKRVHGDKALKKKNQPKQYSPNGGAGDDGAEGDESDAGDVGLSQELEQDLTFDYKFGRKRGAYRQLLCLSDLVAVLRKEHEKPLLAVKGDDDNSEGGEGGEGGKGIKTDEKEKKNKKINKARAGTNGGHRGNKKTYHKQLDQTYNNCSRKVTDLYVDSCRICQAQSVVPPAREPKLRKYQVDDPQHTIQVDSCYVQGHPVCIHIDKASGRIWLARYARGQMAPNSAGAAAAAKQVLREIRLDRLPVFHPDLGPEFKRHYRELLETLGITVANKLLRYARHSWPRGKGKVENAVKFCRRRILAFKRANPGLSMDDVLDELWQIEINM
jgi:hypothetical protein